MKKVIAVLMILAVITALSMLALPVAAVENGKNLGELPQTTEKITVDGSVIEGILIPEKILKNKSEIIIEM